jgi:hypothetical protein
MRSTVTGSLERILFDDSFVRLKNKSLGKCAYRNQGLHHCYVQNFIIKIPVTVFRYKVPMMATKKTTVVWSVATCCLDLSGRRVDWAGKNSAVCSEREDDQRLWTS